MFTRLDRQVTASSDGLIAIRAGSQAGGGIPNRRESNSFSPTGYRLVATTICTKNAEVPFFQAKTQTALTLIIRRVLGFDTLLSNSFGERSE
jgi:hypothetical protein